MKKQIFTTLSIAFIASSLVFTSCKKDDLDAPTLTLLGADATIDLGDTYVDAGATANDANDGNITTSITKTGTVDATKVGTYTLTYAVSDKAGNAATEVKRTVKVKSDKLAGVYNVSDVVTGSTPTSGNGTYTYSVTVSQSSTDYNKIILAGFMGIASASATATINGSVITVASQAVNGANPATSVSGTGTYDGVTKKILSFQYTASNVFYGVGNATYTKQ
jgi:hypothetical protein